MFQIRRLAVQGFRGFAGCCEFKFESPVTILCGGNHEGKSSTLNAIEWCFFGDEVIGKDTGIRERVNWIIQNRDLPSTDVCVELEVADSTHQLVIRRTARKIKSRT